MKILVELKGHENCNSYQLNCPIFQKAITIEKKIRLKLSHLRKEDIRKMEILKLPSANVMPLLQVQSSEWPERSLEMLRRCLDHT